MGAKKSGGVAIKRCFNNEVRCAMIATLDTHGFIPSTIYCVQLNEMSTEGAAGTIDVACFEEWVEYHVFPTLGNYSKGEPRSTLVMGNASTHMVGRVVAFIRSKGICSLHAALCSPDLSPIECAFNPCKSQLKRNERAFKFD